jgi:hypothetical protein
MFERVKPFAYVATSMFAVYVLGRFAAWLVRHSHHAEDRQYWIALVTGGLIALIASVFTFRWMQRRPLGEALPQMIVVIAAACFASALLGPFAYGVQPFHSGPGAFFETVWLFFAWSLGGVLAGVLVVMSAGKDYRAQALKRFADSKLTRPRRVVGR